MPKSLPIVRMVTCVALALLVSTAWGDTPMVTPADGEVMAPGHDAYLEPVASDSSVVVAGGGVNDRLRPDPEGMEVSVENGITGWSSAGEHIVWYGQFPTAGRVDLRLALRLPAGERSTLKLSAESWPLSRMATGAGRWPWM